MEATDGKYKWVVLALTCSLCFIGNFAQYQASTYATQIMPVLGIDAVGFSFLFLAPMLSAVLLSLPFGYLGDSWGPKSVVLIGFACSLVGGLMRIFTMSDYRTQLVAMFLIGIGMAALTANNAKTLGLWFSSRTDMAMGIYYASACLGIAAAQGSSAFISQARDGYIATEILMLSFVVLWAVFDRNVRSSRLIPDESITSQAMRVALRSKNVWLIALCVAFTLAATTCFSSILPQALELEKGCSTAESGTMAAAMTVAGMLGCLATPMLYGRCRNTRRYLIVVCLVGACAIVTSYLVNGRLELWTLLIINGLVTSMMGPVLQAMPVYLPEIGSKYAGSAGGIIAEVSLLGTYAIPILITALSGGSYTVDAVLIGICYGLASIPVLFLPEVKHS